VRARREAAKTIDMAPLRASLFDADGARAWQGP
jgi:hypothetical protein